MSAVAPPPPRALPAAEALLRRVRLAWRRAVLARALLLAPGLALAAALLLVAADLLHPLSAAAREGLRWLPAVLPAGVLGWALLRAARPPADRRLALLAEERVPELGNRLLTALDLRAEAGPVARAFRAEAEGWMRRVDARAVVPLRAARPLALLGTVGIVSAGLALLFPGAVREAWERWARPVDAYESAWREARADVLPAAAPAPVPGFGELRWSVRPPAYTGLPEREARGGEAIALLPGSRVRLRSRFPERWEGVRARLIGGGALPVRSGGGEWRVEWTQGEERGVELEALAGGEVAARRVVPLALLVDRPPDVALREPEHDLVLPSGSGRVRVRAAARDDFGVGDFRLTWIRSRGSGESFTFEEGEWRWERVGRSGGAVTGEHTLDLGAMELRPGDMLHLRAVARDRNDVGGPGESVSQTRVVRIARPDEVDQVNVVVGITPEVEKNPLLSQRMLILMTERLRDRAPRMERAAVLEEAREIAHEQGRLRDRVGEQIFTRATGGVQPLDLHVGFQEEGGGAHGHEHAEAPPSPEETLEEASRATGEGKLEEFSHRHDEAPIVAVDRRLMAIYNAMWAAERELNQGAPSGALPYQYEALRLVKEAQEGERRYVRGTVRVDPVDVPGTRGTGEVDEAAPAARSAGPAAPSLAPLLAELDRAGARLGSGGRRAALELGALAGELLAHPGADARAAVLLSRAAEAAGRGRVLEARALLRRARAMLAPSGGAASAPSVPETADPAAAEYFRRLGGRP